MKLSLIFSQIDTDWIIGSRKLVIPMNFCLQKVTQIVVKISNNFQMFVHHRPYAMVPDPKNRPTFALNFLTSLYI
jgi:hypothetical protein